MLVTPKILRQITRKNGLTRSVKEDGFFEEAISLNGDLLQFLGPRRSCTLTQRRVNVQVPPLLPQAKRSMEASTRETRPAMALREGDDRGSVRRYAAPLQAAVLLPRALGLRRLVSAERVNRPPSERSSYERPQMQTEEAQRCVAGPKLIIMLMEPVENISFF